MRRMLNHILKLSLRFKWVVVFGSLTACVDLVNFKVPKTDRILVVEGLITDQPGPYVVKISEGFTTDQPMFSNRPISGAKVSLFADEFYLGDFEETDIGVYQAFGITGYVGRTYYITIETAEGKHYISEPELMRPVGEVTDVRAEYEERIVQTPQGPANGDRFRIYVDGNITSEPESFVRWRFNGTYLVRTNPEFAVNFSMGVKYPDPFECSGYVRNGNNIAYVAPCTCCTCWVTEEDDLWFVGASKDVNETGYKDIFVGQANINNLTFMERYHVEIQQMSLSPRAYEFFRQLAAQAEGVGSLFQPSTGPIRGNVSAVDSDEQVLGFFYASSIKSKSIDLTPKDVPYKITPPDTIAQPCTAFRGASTVKPAFW